MSGHETSGGPGRGPSRQGDALLQSEERFRLLVESVKDYAIFLLDPEGRIVSWNDGAERMIGYAAREVIGKHVSVFYTPQAVNQGRPAWALRTALERGRVEEEGWQVRRDSSYFWANATLAPVYDPDGELLGFARIVRDLTEQHKMEEVLEVDRHKNHLLSLLAHELRNPLAPLRSAIYVMTHTDDRDATRTAAALAERQLQRVEQLLVDILDLNDITQGAFLLDTAQVDLGSVIARAAEETRAAIEERGIRLEMRAQPDTVWVLGDAERLGKVVSTLLGNAMRYTDPGGTIFVGLDPPGPQAVLRVRDSGAGIEPAAVPRVFDPFVQADRRTERAVGGVGLGLTLVQRIVELHTGTIDAFSGGVGAGTEFVVRLPAIARPALKAVHSQNTDRASSRRVLVVDDNVDAADSLAILLRLEGYQVEAVYSGEDALASARADPPWVILLDLGMPGVDGFEVARQLRRQPRLDKALMIAVTGWGSDSDRHAAAEAGFDRYLVKPVDPDALLDVLEEASDAPEERRAS
jgi:PAS domain S-box-containing protein